MALRVAVATGNWSNPAIWNAGVLPIAGDVVASNGFTVTIDQNVNVDLLTNTVQSPVVLTPIMTSNTTPSGIVSASSYFSNNPNFLPFRAFDRATNTNWLSNGTTGWLAYEFPTLKVVDKYQVLPPSDGSPTSVPRNWTFEAWNGSSWVVLDTVTGNSGTATVTRTLTNTTAYIQYRINITLNNGNGSYSGISELYLYGDNDYGANSVAGGGFILNGGVTINSQNLVGYGIVNGNTTCITFSASGTSVINGRIVNGSAISNINTIFFSGNGTLTINGDFDTGESSGRNNVLVTGNGILNINGNLSHRTNSQNISINAGANIPTLNIVGSFSTGGSGSAANVSVGSNCIINITGNVPTSVNSGRCLTIASTCTVNITGNIVGNGGSGNAIGLTGGTPSIYITGTVFGNPNQPTFPTISSGLNHYYYHVGMAVGADGGVGLSSTSSGAINIMTGPFVCSNYGFVPFQCVRMHLIPTTTSYFEFRDETTNGAVSPGAIAPATRLVSPATIADNPTPANVRFGTVYSIGTQTGTLRMPHPNQVTYGVAVDNTFGNAVLTAASVWDYLVANITVENSIGMRLKNVSTPQTTGEQLEAFLRLE
jgi:hypothetical protein